MSYAFIKQKLLDYAFESQDLNNNLKAENWKFTCLSSYFFASDLSVYLRVFEVTHHKYNIRNFPRCTSIPGCHGRNHLQEFSDKSEENRSWLLNRGFSRSLITNMASATFLGAPGARGGTVEITYRSFPTNQRKIDRDFTLGGFRGRWSRIWHSQLP